MKESLRWPKLLWAVVLVGLVVAWMNYVDYRSTAKFGMVIWLYLIWPVCIALAVLLFLFRSLRWVGRESFMNILFGVINATVGGWGLLIGFESGKRQQIYFSVGLFLWNIIIAVIVGMDVFVWEIPAWKRKGSAKERLPLS